VADSCRHRGQGLSGSVQIRTPSVSMTKRPAKRVSNRPTSRAVEKLGPGGRGALDGL